MHGLIKFCLWSLFGLVLLVAAAGAAGFVWLKSSLPPLEGQLALTSLEAPVEVLRDEDGVVTIRAGNEADAYRALGYVHAQDRLWQMDFMRRTGAGRLSEVVGERTLGLDRLMRGLDLYRLAEASLDQLSPEARALLESYTAGVNDYIAAPTGPWPPGFQLLRTAPEPWRPADSMIWARLMTLQLSGNWQQEVQRLKLEGRLPARAIAFLWPRAPADSPVTVHAALDPLGPALDPGPDPGEVLPWEWAPKTASNIWAVDGRNSASDKPVLANDPHLALSAPGLWYLVRIETPELTLAGVTTPGVPFHILGHNGRVAWGLTTTHADTQDLFIEQLVEGRPDHYQTPDGPRPFSVRKDFIQVKGRAPERVTFRSTRHGPVVGDLKADQLGGGRPDDMADDRVLALAWPGLRPDDSSGEALYRMNRARSAAEFAAALDDFDAPVQNIGYADITGRIGFKTVGKVPIRKAGDGFAPVPGWSGAYDWIGWIPAADLPGLEDPIEGRIVNANNRVVGPDYSFLLTSRWPDPRRAERIVQVLDEFPRAHLERHERLQNDSLSLGALGILPRLLAAPQRDPDAIAAHALLAAWDGVMDRNRPEPLVFAAWLDNLTQRLLTPRLGSLFPAFDRPNLPLVAQLLNERPLWCDDPRTPLEETCDQQIAGALSDTFSDLEDRFGGTMAEWRWGDAHQARFAHPLFSHIPLYEEIFGFSVATDGGGDTVNRAVPRFGEPFDQRFSDIHGPGYRAIYDLRQPGQLALHHRDRPVGQPAVAVLRQPGPALERRPVSPARRRPRSRALSLAAQSGLTCSRRRGGPDPRDHHPGPHQGRRRSARRPDHPDAPGAGRAPLPPGRLRALSQAREPAVYRVVQGPGILRQADQPDRRAAQGRGDRHVGRQPRPGRRLPRPAPGHPGDHRDARVRALLQGRAHQVVRRAGGLDRRHPGRLGGRRAGDRGRRGLELRAPYDDEKIIAGQGTIGLELLEDMPDLEAVVVPIGGGGVISGIATALKALKPEIEIYGVEVELFPSMYQTIHEMTPTSGGTTLADGIAVKNPGELTRDIIKQHVKEILLVDEAGIESAVHKLCELQKVVAEGAGAAGVAGILEQPSRFEGRKVAAVVCGGNIDVRLLSAVLARGMVRDGRMVRLRVSIVDQPGVLARLTTFIGECGANIIEIAHQRLFYNVPPKQAEIDLIVETRNAEHVHEIMARLKAGGFPVRVMSSRSDV